MRFVTLVSASLLAAAMSLPLAAAAQANIAIAIDKSTQRMTVAVDGQQRYVWPVSTGRPGYDTPNGKPFTEDSIGMTLATRNLMDSLRSAGAITGGPKPFAPRDRSEFLAALDRAIVRLTRAGFGNSSASS